MGQAAGKTMQLGGRQLRVKQLLAEGSCELSWLPTAFEATAFSTAGGFAFVYLAEDTVTKETFVLKRVKVANDNRINVALARYALSVANFLALRIMLLPY